MLDKFHRQKVLIQSPFWVNSEGFSGLKWDLRNVLLGLGKVEVVGLLERRERALELARRHRVEDDPLALQPVHE